MTDPSAFPAWSQLAVFAAVALIVLITPGPAVLYIVARSVGDGVRTGIASAVGMTIGSLVHLILLVGGIAVLVSDRPQVAGFIQLAGSVYLVVLGSRRLLDGESQPPPDVVAGTLRLGRFSRAAIVDGAVVNLLNPKAIVFMLAFLPQFAAGAPADALNLQLVVFGLVFIGIGVFTDLAYALIAGRVRNMFERSPSRIHRLGQVSAVLILLLGLAGLANLIAGDGNGPGKQ